MTNKAHISKNKAIRVAREYIAKVERRIEREHEDAIVQIMNKRFFAPKTRDDAIHKLKTYSNNDLFSSSTWNRIERQGSYWTSLAESVIRMCENTCADFVILDDETISFLFKE